jgi:hypothetical protein
MELMGFFPFLIWDSRRSGFGLVINTPDLQEPLARYFEVAREIDELKLPECPRKLTVLAGFPQQWDDPPVIAFLVQGEE